MIYILFEYNDIKRSDNITLIENDVNAVLKDFRTETGFAYSLVARTYKAYLDNNTVLDRATIAARCDASVQYIEKLTKRFEQTIVFHTIAYELQFTAASINWRRNLKLIAFDL